MNEPTIRTGPSINKGKSKQDYGTPWEFIRACARRFGQIHVDLAASRDNRKADIFFTEEQDSLKQDWRRLEGTLWLNPPFANIAPWAEKCAVEGANRAGLLLFLTPASIGTEWFSRHVERKAVVLGLAPRLTFEGTSDPYPKDLMLSVFGYGLSGFGVWRWDAPLESPSNTPETK